VANEKIKYSNGCSPQELDSTSARWYQDSDVGTKLSGWVNIAPAGGSFAFVSPVSITGNQSELATKDFVYIKCISGDDVKVSFDAGSNFLVRLSAGESFASELDSSVARVIIGTAGTSTVEYLSGLGTS
jgi:hypothetical protein